MTSMKKTPTPHALPDFRNLGVLMRVLLGVSGMEIAAAVIRAASWPAMLDELFGMAAYAQPILLLSLAVLVVLSDWLRRLPYAAAAGAIMALELLIAAFIYRFVQNLLIDADVSLWRCLLFTALASGVLLIYFEVRGRAWSPALTEARLQALQARIRPHFLFNSMTAVLSLIRTDPRRAESVLEDMADLFRVMLSDTRQLSSLAREIDLCRQYLDIEQLRLSERLNVQWKIENMPADALIPPLVLQPLIENAVYHGIEPRIAPGTIVIEVYRKERQVHAVIRHPNNEPRTPHGGNRIALENIRERLALHFDAEASLTARIEDGIYEVHIVIPYRREAAAD